MNHNLSVLKYSFIFPLLIALSSLIISLSMRKELIYKIGVHQELQEANVMIKYSFEIDFRTYFLPITLILFTLLCAFLVFLFFHKSKNRSNIYDLSFFRFSVCLLSLNIIISFCGLLICITLMQRSSIIQFLPCFAIVLAIIFVTAMFVFLFKFKHSEK